MSAPEKIEASVLSASFAHYVHSIAVASDPQRALELVQRLKRTLDAGYRVRLEPDQRRQRALPLGGGR